MSQAFCVVTFYCTNLAGTGRCYDVSWHVHSTTWGRHSPSPQHCPPQMRWPPVTQTYQLQWTWLPAEPASIKSFSYDWHLNFYVCVQSQMGHALAQGQRNQGQPEFTSSPLVLKKWHCLVPHWLRFHLFLQYSLHGSGTDKPFSLELAHPSIHWKNIWVWVYVV